MADKQLQVRSREYAITPRTRPRGITGQVWTVVLQPVYFFRTMPMLADTRSWLWAAILVLLVSGISAVRQETLLNEAAPVSGLPDFGGAPPGVDLGGGGAIPGGGFEVIPGGGGAIPGDIGGAPLPDPAPGGNTDITSTWTTALLTASGIILGWLVLAVLLSEVSLFNGRAPSLGQNLQIAIWASIPLGLMAVLQLVFYAAGGGVGASGISGILEDWEAYQGMSPLAQSLILSLTSRLTLFWLWSLILIYVGARSTLNGKWFASALVVVMWAVLLVVMPVVTGSIKAPEATSEEVLPGDLSGQPPFSEGDIPPGLTDPFGQPIDGVIETTPEAGDTDESGDEREIEAPEGNLIPDTESPVRPNADASEGEASGETQSSLNAAEAGGGQSEPPAEAAEPTPPPRPVNRPGGG